jgi:hypothetical protein
MCVSVHADVGSVVFGQALSLTANHRTGFVREGQPRQPDQCLQCGMRAIHVGADHGQGDLMPGFVFCDLEVRRTQALIVAFGARDLLLQGLDPGVFGAVVVHHAGQSLPVCTHFGEDKSSKA